MVYLNGEISLQRKNMNYGKSASGEKMPKKVISSDMSGEKKGSMSGPNSLKGSKGMSGESIPKGATASDMSGERKAKVVGGVALGKADGIGMREKSHLGKNDGLLGECKGGTSESVVYNHVRIPHPQD
jgi:hypothetical protein